MRLSVCEVAFRTIQEKSILVRFYGSYYTVKEEALHRIQLAHTDMEVFKVVNSLAVALGARRTEMGTVKALHAVLLQLVRPGISNAEACNATGASTSNFSKWRRQV